MGAAASAETARAGAARSVAFRRLRVGGRRQVDLDRPAHRRDRRGSGRSHRSARALVAKIRQRRGQARLRAPARRARGRARAGHHHHRYFATPRRAFLVADTPGHEQYTRNMATGASHAEVALVLVDARNGITVQTYRHTRIAALLGIRRVLLVVNKMDLVGFAQTAFAAIRDGFDALATPLGISVAAIPAVAPDGDNVVRGSARMPWHPGPTVLE